MLARRPKVAVVVSIVAGLFLFGVYLADDLFRSRRVLLKTEYPSSLTGSFLREDEALTIASRAMQEAGYLLHVPFPDHRTHAPDGTPDRYLSRNDDDATQGIIMFRDAHRQDWYRDLFVHVKKRNDQAMVVVERGK